MEVAFGSSDEVEAAAPAGPDAEHQMMQGVLDSLLDQDDDNTQVGQASCHCDTWLPHSRYWPSPFCEIRPQLLTLWCLKNTVAGKAPLVRITCLLKGAFTQRFCFEHMPWLQQSKLWKLVSGHCAVLAHLAVCVLQLEAAAPKQNTRATAKPAPQATEQPAKPAASTAADTVKPGRQPEDGAKAEAGASSNTGKTVFVRSLPADVSRDQLHIAFKKFGGLRACRSLPLTVHICHSFM